MNDPEKYKINVDIIDELNVQKILLDKSTIRRDLDIVKRLKKENVSTKIAPLAAAVIGINNTAAPIDAEQRFQNLWTNIDAQEQLLNTKPANYIVFSKPLFNEYKFAEQLSRELNCIHLHPKTILNDEIDQKSGTGVCLDFNMRHNNVIRFDILLKILKTKLDSQVINHRGYIISGFPMIFWNQHKYYLFKSLHGEESLKVVKDLVEIILNNSVKKQTKKIYEDEDYINETLIEEEVMEEHLSENEDFGLEEEENKPILLPKFILNTCSHIITKEKNYINSIKAVLIEQFHEILNIQNKPEIIIHITSPDVDYNLSKNDKIKDVLGKEDPILDQEPSYLEVTWPKFYSTISIETIQENMPTNNKYWCKHPFNYEKNSIIHLCNFNVYLYPCLDMHMQGHDPQKMIKVDGRLSINTVLDQVLKRILRMPLNPVYIPALLNLEEVAEDVDDFWQSNFNVIEDGALKFSRYASPWYNRCPVELKKRHTVVGKPKYAVTYLWHVYQMASLDNLISFYKNPRPYLKINYLEPTSRVFVMGTRLSGVTMVSKCLSWIFDAPVIEFSRIIYDEKIRKMNAYSESILKEIMATIEHERLSTWDQDEENRLENLDKWYNDTYNSLEKYVLILEQLYMLINNETEYEKTEDIVALEAELNLIKPSLSDLPILDELAECKTALDDKDFLMRYAPKNLSTSLNKPAVPLLSDKDVTEKIAQYIENNELQNEIEPTIEELISELCRKLNSFDHIHEISGEVTYGKWIVDGFPTGPEYWASLSERKMVPDITIAIMENREIDDDLKQHYKIIEHSIKIYEERFALSSDPLIKLTLKNKSVYVDESSVTTAYIVLNDIINGVFDLKEFGNDGNFDEGGNTRSSLYSGETKSRSSGKEEMLVEGESLHIEYANFDTVREDWEGVKIILAEYSKAFIEVEIKSKSDIDIMDEILLKVRQCYSLTNFPNEDEVETEEDEETISEDMLVYNSPIKWCELKSYCPVAYYDYGVLWEGKPEFNLKLDCNMHYFCNEDSMQSFCKDITNYQYYNKPLKYLPPLRICIIGPVGSGKSTISKFIAKELGLFHIDYLDFINDTMIPKHLNKVGLKHEKMYDQVFEGESESLENLNESDSNILTENEIRSMIYSYFEHGRPLPYEFIQRVIKLLWFEEPYKSTGFVLDGFPKLTDDVEVMTSNFCIPDLVIELECSSTVSLDRLIPEMMKSWKEQITQLKVDAKKAFDIKIQNWTDFITKQVIARLICEEVVNDAVPLDHDSKDQLDEVEIESEKSATTDDQLISSVVIDTDIIRVYNDTIEEYPKPISDKVWETSDEAQMRFESRLESIHEVETENIENLRETLTEENVKYENVNGELRFYKVLKQVLSKLTELRNRNESFFEQTFILDSDKAKELLSNGLCLLSKFYRMCPVHIYEQPDSIIIPYKLNEEVYHVVHRSYIYFLNGEDNVKKFRNNPLKYLLCNSIASFFEFPLSIGVIGPPKCGKSVLTAKLAKQYGLMPISRGTALRYVMDALPRTDLAVKIASLMNKAEIIESDLVMQAIQTTALDYRTSCHGFVLDGFPENPSEALQLAKYGLYPLIIFDIQCNKDKLLENTCKEVHFDILKHMPPYPSALMELKYQIWNEQAENIRGWIHEDYDNVYIIDARRVPVPDERYDYLCEYHKPLSKVPAFLNVVDIAGLVKGAAEGQGLGNAFLSHIKACDAIFNLCRAFDDEDVIHVDGSVDPVRDLQTIADELRLKDEEQLLQHIEKLDRQVNRGNDKKLKPEFDALQKIKTVLVDEKKHIRFGDWSAAEIEVLNKYLFITSKPALYLVNLSEKDYTRKKNKWLPKLKEWIDKNDPGAALIPFSGVLEYKLMDMDAPERAAYLKENNITSALDKIIVQGYKALQLEYFFTAGADEVKAWTIQKGTKAPQAAGRIHTDFEKGFIMAEVMHFKDFKEEGSEAACKAAGKYRQQGRNYVVEDGDIIFFKFNAGAGLKDAKKK
ncbi:unnamed protein product [Plutella xylostella]|uniref:(diamondback moth) hypothetical protein n=1 Tax=Plutella xylostella TaxID=51655 RepID=A0A8S4DDT8_PLUXY|nr:unnamed protein product [Plutella xylostella]